MDKNQEDDVWDQLNNLVQLLYSTTNVRLVVSEYKKKCWQLHVLDQHTMYSIQFNSQKELQDIMEQRQPIASSPDQFVQWFSSQLIQGHLSFVTAAGMLRIGDKDEWLELRLNHVKDTLCRQEFSWQLLLKFTQHVQKQGCIIDAQQLRSSSSVSFVNKLQEENTSLKSELKTLSMQKPADASTVRTDTGNRSGTGSSNRSHLMAKSRTKGMSLINPGVIK